MSEGEAISKSEAGRGEKLDFAALFDSCSDRLYNTVLRLVGNAEDALDIVQDAFLKAWRSASGFKGESRFYTWIYRIAVNTALSHRRSAATRLARSSVSLDEEVGNPDSYTKREIPDETCEASRTVSSRELNDLVAQEISKLEPELRAAVVLRDVEALSYDEISEILEIPKGTVKSRLHRGRLVLRERLRDFL